MQSVQRLEYMKQLGIDVYVPRIVLPQARASATAMQPQPARKKHLVSAVSAGTGPEPRRETPTSRPALDLPDLAVATPATRPAPMPRPKLQTATTAPVRFQLLTVAFHEHVLFVSELRTAPLAPALEASVLQFLGELMFALGRPAARASAPGYFQWPLVNRQGADTSVELARDVLAGFLERQLRETRPQHVVLLGDQAAEHIQPQGEGLLNFPVQVWRGQALGKLFARPQLKADLWRQLQPLIDDV